MTWQTLLTVILLAIALAMDAFAVSVVDGLTCQDLSRKQKIFAPSMFGLFQGFMPLIGYFIAFFFVSQFTVLEEIVPWIAFILLCLIGTLMLIEAVKDLKKTEEEVCGLRLTYKKIFFQAIATSIDALAVGVTLLDLTNDAYTPYVFLYGAIICVITFAITLVGIHLGKKIKNIFQNKIAIAEIIGGVILVLIGVEIVITHYFPLPF
jgi:putative Mn2+ efflux pump MntP